MILLRLPVVSMEFNGFGFLADRYKRRDLLEGQLMLLVSKTMKNYVRQLNACLDWKGC